MKAAWQMEMPNKSAAEKTISSGSGFTIQRGVLPSISTLVVPDNLQTSR